MVYTYMYYLGSPEIEEQSSGQRRQRFRDLVIVYVVVIVASIATVMVIVIVIVKKQAYDIITCVEPLVVELVIGVRTGPPRRQY